MPRPNVRLHGAGKKGVKKKFQREMRENGAEVVARLGRKEGFAR